MAWLESTFIDSMESGVIVGAFCRQTKIVRLNSTITSECLRVPFHLKKKINVKIHESAVLHIFIISPQMY